MRQAISSTLHPAEKWVAQFIILRGVALHAGLGEFIADGGDG